MSGLLSTLVNGLIRARANSARGLVREELLTKDDRLLADIGISRELLEEGVGAWPWRIDQRGDGATRPAPRTGSTPKDFFTESDFSAMGMASRGVRGGNA